MMIMMIVNYDNSRFLLLWLLGGTVLWKGVSCCRVCGDGGGGWLFF